PHGPRPARHLGKDRQDGILHHAQLDRGDLSLRRRFSDESAAGPGHRHDRDRFSAATGGRYHRQRGLRPHSQSHLALDRGGAGVVAGSSHTLAAPTAPVLSSILAIPLIILYPPLMAWLGIGPLSKVVFGVLSGFFPIALNTIDGVRAIERRYLVFARSIGATKLQTYARIIFPLALPAMISGLRVGTGLVVIGVIVTERLAWLGGIGYLISYHRCLFVTGRVQL